jgi:uncharacterized protein (TIGR00251 family)
LSADALRLSRDADGVGFHIHVTPRARTRSVGPVHGDALRVSVSAPPVEGRANKACVEALAEALDVPKSAVEIDPGARNRRKRVRVAGDPDALASRLRALASKPGLG